jgi:hypothetical protein
MSDTSNNSGLFLSFGSGVRLISEDQFLRQFMPAGLTRAGFRRLCRALTVPMIEIGSTRYVDMLSMLLALRSVLRVGEKDFLTPGCQTVRDQRDACRDKSTTRKLDTKRFQQNLHITIAELVAASRINGVRLGSDLSSAATAAARRLALAGLHHYPAREQEDFSHNALRKAFTDRVFEEPVEVPPKFSADSFAIPDRARTNAPPPEETETP